MSIVVQKYGGSSVADVTRIRQVAERIMRTKASGHDVAVVVSAMGDTTDELLALARKVATNPDRRELDMLLSAGERISTSTRPTAINSDMSMPVEVRLRVPNMKVRALDENGYPIDHASMRFRKVIELPKIPKPEEMLDLTTSSGRTLQARVVRADWNEGRGLFVLSCQYANRSITAEEYGALASDPDWQLKHLLE